MPELVLQKVLGGDAFAEIGEPTGVYPSPDGRYLAVAGTFDHGNWVRHLRLESPDPLVNRVAVYDSSSLGVVSEIDAGMFLVNDVGWHPSEPILAIGTGQYDGGFYFEGDLILWEVVQQRVARPFNLDGDPFGRQVVGCIFESDGHLSIQAMPEGATGPPAVRYMRTFSIPENVWRRFPDRSIPVFGHFDETETDRSGRDVERAWWPDTTAKISELMAIAEQRRRTYEPRWRACDVAWAPDGRVMVVRNGTALEVWHRDGTLEFRVPHRSDGMRVMVSPDSEKAYCNVWSRNPDDDFRENPDKYAAVLEVDLRSGEAEEIETNPATTAPAGYSRLQAEGARNLYFLRASREPKGDRLIKRSGWIATGDSANDEPRDLFSVEWDGERDGYLTVDASVYVGDDSGTALIIASHVTGLPPAYERYFEVNRREPTRRQMSMVEAD